MINTKTIVFGLKRFGPASKEGMIKQIIAKGRFSMKSKDRKLTREEAEKEFERLRSNKVIVFYRGLGLDKGIDAFIVK